LRESIGVGLVGCRRLSLILHAPKVSNVAFYNNYTAILRTMLPRCLTKLLECELPRFTCSDECSAAGFCGLAVGVGLESGMFLKFTFSIVLIEVGLCHFIVLCSLPSTYHNYPPRNILSLVCFHEFPLSTLSPPLRRRVTCTILSRPLLAINHLFASFAGRIRSL
jgi:hypothetical protein